MKVSHWLIANKLSLNVKKSNAILFRTQNASVSAKMNLKLNDAPIEEKQKAKYLGVIINQKLACMDTPNHTTTTTNKQQGTKLHKCAKHCF